MEKTKEAIKNIQEKKFIQMKENFASSLSNKAVHKLEEKKIEIAKNYFGKK